MEDIRKDELFRFMEWISLNPEFWWLLLCDDDIPADACKSMINQLIENNFYLLVPVIIARTKSLDIEQFLYRLFLKKLCESWKNNSMEEIAEEFCEMLEETVKKKNTSEEEK